MAKNLLIRDLPDSVNEALEQHKQQGGITFNTDAAIDIIEKYQPLRAAYLAQRDELRRLRERLARLKELLRRQREAEQYLDLFLSEDDE